MKKLICLILTLVLLLSLSFSAFAVGNSYSFTSSWFKALFENSLILNNSTSKSYTVSGGVIAIDDLVYNADYNHHSNAVWLTSSVLPGTLSLTIPLNVTLYRSVEYLDLEFFTTSSSAVNITNSTVRVGSSDLSTTITTTDFSDISFGNITHGLGSPVGTYNPIVSGSGQKINIQYFKNLSSSEQVIESITLTFNVASSGQFSLGVPCVNTMVTLPDSFYDAIYSIKIFEYLRYNQIEELNNYILDIQTQLTDLIEALQNSSGSTENYYNTIINPSEDQQAVLDQLQTELEQAKEDLAEVQEILLTAQAPTSEDLSSVNADGTDYSLSVLESSTLSDLTSDILSSFPILVPILLSVLSLATLGYILFGKRG